MCLVLIESSGLIGQNGSEFAIIHADQKMPRVSEICTQPRVTRGRPPRAIQDPSVLPIARPIRNTARMIEKT